MNVLKCQDKKLTNPPSSTLVWDLVVGGGH